MPPAERVVVDTNTIIDGILLPQSVPGRVLQLLTGTATLIFSRATRDELLGVLARKKFDRYVSAEARERAAVILVRDAEMVSPRRFVHVCRDPKDDKFLDAAHAGKADCLISGDGDLVDLQAFDGIPILTARRYLAQHMVGWRYHWQACDDVHSITSFACSSIELESVMPSAAAVLPLMTSSNLVGC